MGQHRNAPLTLEGRRRLVERCRTRPIAHVAAEMGISRATASKWVNRYRAFGDLGLFDRSSTPLRQPTATSGAVVRRIEWMRREHKWSAAHIAFELEQEGVPLSRRTVTLGIQSANAPTVWCSGTCTTTITDPTARTTGSRLPRPLPLLSTTSWPPTARRRPVTQRLVTVRGGLAWTKSPRPFRGSPLRVLLFGAFSFDELGGVVR